MSKTLSAKLAADSKKANDYSLLPSSSMLNTGLSVVGNQVIFSIGNFCSLALVGRYAGATQLGLYSFALTIIFIAAAIQRALVSAPYTVQAQSFADDQRKLRRGSAFVQFLVTSVLLCAISVATVPLIFSLSESTGSIATWVVVAAAVGWGLRDFCRRILFADNCFAEAVWLDGLIVTSQLTCLVIFALNSQITAVTALLVMAISSDVVAIGWLMLRRSLFVVQRDRLVADSWASWRFGRWAALSEATFASQDSVVQGVLAVSSGSFASAGVYAACISVVRLINPFVQATRNFIGPRSARSLQQGGFEKLVADVKRTTNWVGTAMLAYLSFIFISGSFILSAIYGKDYADYHSLLAILSLATAVTALGMAPAKGISAMEKPQLNLLSNLLGLLIVFIAAGFIYEAALAQQLAQELDANAVAKHIHDVAYAVLAGAAVCCFSKWVQFCYLVRRQASDQQAAERLGAV